MMMLFGVVSIAGAANMGEFAVRKCAAIIAIVFQTYWSPTRIFLRLARWFGGIFTLLQKEVALVTINVIPITMWLFFLHPPVIIIKEHDRRHFTDL